MTVLGSWFGEQYRIQDAGYKIHDTGCRLQDTGCKVLTTHYSLLITHHSLLFTGKAITLSYTKECGGPQRVRRTETVWHKKSDAAFYSSTAFRLGMLLAMR